MTYSRPQVVGLFHKKDPAICRNRHIHVYIYTYMYCIYICISISTSASASASMSIYLATYLCICVYTYIHIYAYYTPVHTRKDRDPQFYDAPGLCTGGPRQVRLRPLPAHPGPARLGHRGAWGRAWRLPKNEGSIMWVSIKQEPKEPTIWELM